MVTIIKKWGNCLALRIPSSLAKDMQLSEGSVVEVAVANGRMLIKPEGHSRNPLSQLLKGIAKSNRHPGQNYGNAVGRERL